MAVATLPPDILAAMDEAIRDEFEKTARLRKTIPEVEAPHSRYGVMVPTLSTQSVVSASTSQFVVPVKLWVEVQFDSTQVEDDELTVQLVRAATRLLAAAEDTIIAYGNLDGIQTPVRAEHPSFADNATPSRVACLAYPNGSTKATTLDCATRDALEASLACTVEHMDTHGVHKPYGLALGPVAWADYLKLWQADQRDLTTMLGGNALASVGRSRDVGGAAPYYFAYPHDVSRLDLVRVLLPTGTTRGFDGQGNTRYFIEAQFLLRVKDPGSLRMVPLCSETAGIDHALAAGLPPLENGE